MKSVMDKILQKSKIENIEPQCGFKNQFLGIHHIHFPNITFGLCLTLYQVHEIQIII